MESFQEKDGQAVVLDMVAVIRKNKQYLSDIDGAIGDGDHGINMNKGFSFCGERLTGKEVGLSRAFETLGEILLTEIGGSIGPLYGSFFMEMGAVCKGKERVDKELFRDMIAAGRTSIQDLGEAKVGDKTLIDTLIPAETAFETAARNNEEFIECLAKMRIAAERGKDSTIGLVAKIGRSSRLGERSRGALDAGATSCYLLLDSMAMTISRLLEG
jgi:phosphoenolpyruvate---glycerone phosphotransferase subunit DhaL